MTCDQATFMLERRWDHALSGEDERTLDEHIEACAVCRAEAEAIAMADAVFMHLPEMDPPVNIAAAVAQQIAEEAPAERSRGWVWGSLAALAAILAAMWSFGITPAVLWNSPALTAIVAPLAGTVAGWLRPITLPLQALSPAYGVIAAGLLVIVALEAAMVAFWMKRPGGRVAGQAGQA